MNQSRQRQRSKRSSTQKERENKSIQYALESTTSQPPNFITTALEDHHVNELRDYPGPKLLSKISNPSQQIRHKDCYCYYQHLIKRKRKKMHLTWKKTPVLIVLILTLLSSILQQQNQQPSYVVQVDAITSQEWSIIKPFVKTGIGVTGCVLGVATCAACIRVITTGDECLVERFGKYHRRLDAGWHVLLPIVERVSFHATTREQVLDVPPQQCYTKDNAPIQADAVVYMRIQDVISAKYNVEDVYSAIMNLCLTQLREQVGRLTLDESFSSRERINYALLKDLNEVCQGWGIQITRVELQNLQPSPTIKEAMELQMAAERKKRSAILKSEGERTTLINEAEGRAQAAICDAEAQSRATILKAEAESNRQRIEAEGLQIAIEAITDAIMKNQRQDNNNTKARENAVEGAIQFLSVLRFLETQATFADSNNSKVIMLPSKDSLPLTYGGLKYLMD